MFLLLWEYYSKYYLLLSSSRLMAGRMGQRRVGAITFLFSMTGFMYIIYVMSCEIHK